MKMSSRFTSKKNKRTLQTTLGKASHDPGKEDETDLSHMWKPIQTSIFGLEEVLALFKTATEEVKHYVSYECDIMYECRVCRTIYRSLANFILHKRNYCREKFDPRDQKVCRNNCQNNEFYVAEVEKSNREHRDEESSALENCAESQPKLKQTKRNMSSVLQKLLQKQHNQKLVEEELNKDLSDNTNEIDEVEVKKSDIALEKIESTDAGVFQTMFRNMAQEHGKMDFMKSEVMELHGIFSSDEAVLGPDGKALVFEMNKSRDKTFAPKNCLICTICNQKFSTRKTLTYHVKYKHNNTRMVYPCPVCKDQFANAWCVFRHLYKVHRKTTAQIRRMRDHIHSSAFRKDQIPTSRKDAPVLFSSSSSSNNSNSENQWMEDFEGDNDLQMCGGCGRRFERKAALHSHSQLCIKRIAVCNTIKESNSKQAQVETKVTKSIKFAKNCPENNIKGSERRKPLIIMRKCSTQNANSKTVNPDNSDIKVGVVSTPEHVEITNFHKNESTGNVSIKTGRRKSILMARTCSEDDTNKAVDLDNTNSSSAVVDSLLENVGKTDSNKYEKTGNIEIKNYNVEVDDSIICNSQTNTVNTNQSGCDTVSGIQEASSTDDVIYVDNVTIDPIKDLQVQNENELNLSSSSIESSVTLENDLFVTEIPSISPVDLCNIIGVPVLKYREIPNDHLISIDSNDIMPNQIDNPEVNSNNAELIYVDDSNSGGALLHLLDNEKTRDTYSQLNSDIENALKEIKSFCDEEECPSEETLSNVNKICDKLEESSNSEEITPVCSEINLTNNTVNNNGNEDNARSLADPSACTSHKVDEESDVTEISLLHSQEINKADDTLKIEAVNIAKRKRTSADDNSREKIVRSDYADYEIMSNETTLETKSQTFMDKDQLLCLPCNMKMLSFYCLMEHMSDHFNWFCYQCRLCSFMSYYKATCVLHVEQNHQIEKPLVDNAVLPVPSWKTLQLSTNFTPNEAINASEEHKKLPKVQNSSLNSISQDSEPEVTVVIEEKPHNDAQDPAVRKMIMEVIFGSDMGSSLYSNGTEKYKVESCKDPHMEDLRPIRNRTKSIKVVQDDFLYDTKKIPEADEDNLLKKESGVSDKHKTEQYKSLFAQKLTKPLKVYGKKTTIKNSKTNIQTI